jgi:hypothetical protein
VKANYRRLPVDVARAAAKRDAAGYRDFFSDTGFATGTMECDEPLVEPAASAGGPTSRRTPW